MMISMVRGFLGAFFLLSATTLFAQGEVQDKATGISFPKDVSFNYSGKEYHLNATGVATRKKFFITVYSVAHYLEDGADKSAVNKIAAIMNGDNAKQLTIKWARNLPVDRVRDGYHESFRTAIPAEELYKLQGEVNQFIGYFNKEVVKGEEHIIRWIPGGNIEVLIDGNKVGDIHNEAFAKGLWNIWFGEKSVVNRDNLISLMK